VLNEVPHLYLTKHHAMKYGGVGVQLHAFVTSALDRGEWPYPHPRERAPTSKYSLDRSVELGSLLICFQKPFTVLAVRNMYTSLFN